MGEANSSFESTQTKTICRCRILYHISCSKVNGAKDAARSPTVRRVLANHNSADHAASQAHIIPYPRRKNKSNPTFYKNWDLLTSQQSSTNRSKHLGHSINIFLFPYSEASIILRPSHLPDESIRDFHFFAYFRG